MVLATIHMLGEILYNKVIRTWTSLARSHFTISPLNVSQNLFYVY